MNMGVFCNFKGFPGGFSWNLLNVTYIQLTHVRRGFLGNLASCLYFISEP